MAAVPIFAKLSSTFHRHPKARRAGYHGCNVFLFLLELNAELGATGHIPAAHADAFYLADALMCSEQVAAEGLELAVKAKLLEVQPDGSVVIVGWDDEEWGRGVRGEPLSGAERQRRHVERKRARQSDDPVTHADVADASDVTPSAVTSDDANDDRVRVRSRDQSSGNSPPPRDPTVPTTVHQQPVAAAPEHVQHALTRLRAARRELDPNARELSAFGGQSETDLLQRLRPYDAAERRAVLDHVLDAAIALARERGTVDRLYLGGIATSAAWEMLAAKASPHRPRAGPKRASHQRHTAADELTAMFESGVFEPPPSPSPKDTP